MSWRWTQLEAGRLLAAARVELADGEVAELTRRTEGWPVALYLAALSIKAQHPRNGAGVGLSGRERFLVDYLQSVLLAGLSPTEVQFLTRTAVLDRLSGPLCDAVLGTTGSAAVLASLERSNLLVVPLDRQREWYRYHQLFRELLRGELERYEPELVRELTLRAAQWCAQHGLAEAAIGYAMDAGDADLVARGRRAGGHRRLPQRPAGHRPALVRLVRRPRADPAVSRGGHARGLDPGARRPRGRG